MVINHIGRLTKLAKWSITGQNWPKWLLKHPKSTKGSFSRLFPAAGVPKSGERRRMNLRKAILFPHNSWKQVLDTHSIGWRPAHPPHA